MAHIRPEGFPCSSVGKESACSAGDPGLIPGLGRYPGEGNGNPFQYPCLEKSHGPKSRGGGGGSPGGAEETGGSPWGPKESGTTGQLTLTYLLIGPDPKWVDFYLRAFFSTPYL